MIVTYNWLKEFVDCQLTPEELSHRLTMAGLEVDAMEEIGAGLDSVIVARLLSVEKHPDAERLTLCQVDTGAGEVQVVCGAKNHRTGDLVALAQVGSLLPGDFKIKKSKIRGQESRGMLCSEKELGLSEESAGIMILPAGLPLGQPVFAALGLKDVRFELGLTPNRSDCLSVVGVAREIAAMTGNELRLPTIDLVEAGAPIEGLTSVTIHDPDLCPRYAARLIQGVKIGPSPAWLARRLESVGQRPINNVVDVTNFVLMELGHPLHAFDYKLLREGRIEVARAEVGEQFTTLDGQERLLCQQDLMICDGAGSVALAGIMGGENSEVQPATVDILLESAYFNPTTVRRSSKRLGIHTEASHRFERGADVNMAPIALDRAAALILEVAGGLLAKGRVDNYPTPIVPQVLQLRVSKTNEILGLKLEQKRICELLQSIQLTCRQDPDGDADLLLVEAPSWRPDLEREVDLIEEVARLNGYDNIPVTMPKSRIVCHVPSRHLSRLAQVKNAMVSEGFSEVVNFSFISPEGLDRVKLAADDPRKTLVRILNPLSEDQSVMRTSLAPSLLETVSHNLAYRCRDLRLFELRPVFVHRPGEDLPEERRRLTAALCGRRSPEGWAQGNDNIDYYDVKGVVENLLRGFRVDQVTWDSSQVEPFLHPGKSCALIVDGQVLGSLGEVHPEVLETFEIDLPVYLLDLDLETLIAVEGGFPGVRALSRFPDVYRDSALLLGEEIPAARILEVVERVKPRIAEEVVLFDLYRGKGIAEGEKSLAMRVRYRSGEKTLTDEEIQAAHGRIIKALEKELGASLR